MDERPLCFLLSKVEGAFVAEFDRGLADAGYGDLSLSHSANVLRFLAVEGVCCASRLAALAHVTKQAMSQQLAQLERRGYVRFEPDPADRRSRLVHLTMRGAEAQVVASGLFKRVEGRWREALGAERYAELRKILETALDVVSV